MDIINKINGILFSTITTSSSHSSWSAATTWPFYVVPVIVIYPILCSSLRHYRINQTLAKYKYGSPSHPSYAEMTDQEAYEIQTITNEWDFPAMYEKGLQFALFRTYGIPSICALLAKTTQLSAQEHVAKRYADTGVIVAEIYGNAPNSERGIGAFSRLNYLHGHYIRQGKISNDDMLYTLALFMNQPPAFINKYEWRQITELEYCAFGVFHKSMADAMQIKLDCLPSAKTGWKDGLHFYHELDEWARQYEEDHMVPDPLNHTIALKTRWLLLSTQPKFLHPFLSNLIGAAMDDRLREAITFETPPAWYRTMLDRVMEVRKWFLRYLTLPRMIPDKYVSEKADERGRRFLTRYDTSPTYIKPTLLNRYGPGSWISRLIGAPVPGDAGMYPEGWIIEDVGPKQFVGKGRNELENTRMRLRKERTGMCPLMVKS